MKVLLLSDAASVHTIRWANALQREGVTIGIFCLGTHKESDYHHSIIIYAQHRKSLGVIDKLMYLRSIMALRKAIREFQPDIVHAHYATSYGLLGSLSGFKPFIISVWGSDVFDFPRRSRLHRLILQLNLSSATKVLSTSRAMANEALLYMGRGTTIEVTPFGIDLQKFSPISETRERPVVVIGTVKALFKTYGIDVLIRAFDVLKSKHAQIGLRLDIIGKGDQENELKELVSHLGRNESVNFLGAMDHAMIPDILKSFDIFAALSDSESFGVSVVEASASGLPVVVTDAGGLPEVVKNGVTGIVVSRRNVEEAANALEMLVLNRQKRQQFGAAGRKRVEELYDWNKNVDQMVAIYKSISTYKK
jgi:glycosyltransferase involved in cell wall biosynthesis